MVNHGASQGCRTCKIRKIKCDESRPRCNRCQKSKRTCLGYSDGAMVKPRRSSTITPPTQSPRSDILQESIPCHAHPDYLLRIGPDPEVLAALDNFFSNFVLTPQDGSLSHGYFFGLKKLLAEVRSDSPLIQALKTVALASTANITHSDDLSCRAQTTYIHALKSFHKSLSSSLLDKAEALMTAALLGLYEMIVATETAPAAHRAHVKGVSAMLDKNDISIDITPGISVQRCFKSLLAFTLTGEAPIPRPMEVSPSLDSESSMRHLDVFLIHSRPVLLQAISIFSNPKASKMALFNLKQQASMLNKEISLWPLCQSKEWSPQPLGMMEKNVQNPEAFADGIPFWPGRIDSYFDLYVAAVWNSYRKIRLQLLSVIVECIKRLQPTSRVEPIPLSLQKLQREIYELVDGLCASVPFHLISDLESCLQESMSMDKFEKHGMALGGLLLMYPLSVAANSPLLQPEQQAWMKSRLHWIGKYMGIRQATRLADTDLLYHLNPADGHPLVFSGSLISSETQDDASLIDVR